MATVAGLNLSDRESFDGLPPTAVIFGRSETMRRMGQKVERVAATDVPLLIQGEHGTGKEILAKFIHWTSPCRNGSFVKVNCPAIPATLIESELFGYEKGSFTGAYTMKPGRVESANRGTLFLDEIAELEPALQAKLLQLLQDGQFCRIGSQENKQAEVRVICATNRQLEQEIEARHFREDLFFRINVVSLQLPPLRERREDIPDLMNYFFEVYQREYNREAQRPSSHLVRLLQTCDWPGNIRQLENLMKRYVILGSEEAISSELSFGGRTESEPEIPLDGSISLKNIIRQTVTELERKIILKALQENHWNRKLAARRLKISYRALLYKIKQAGLPPKRMTFSEQLATATHEG